MSFSVTLKCRQTFYQLNLVGAPETWITCPCWERYSNSRTFFKNSERVIKKRYNDITKEKRIVSRVSLDFEKSQSMHNTLNKGYTSMYCMYVMQWFYCMILHDTRTIHFAIANRDHSFLILDA